MKVSKTRLVVRLALVGLLIGVLWMALQVWQRSRPEFYWSRYERAVAADDLAAAEIYLQNLVRRFPQFGPAQMALADLCLDLAQLPRRDANYARHPAAMSHLAEAARLMPENGTVHAKLLEAYLVRGQMPLAAASAGVVIDKQPQHAGALFALLWRAVQARELAAEEWLERLSQVPSTRPFRALALGAEFYRQAGKPAKLQTMYQRAVDLAEQTPAADFLLLAGDDRQVLGPLLLETVHRAPDIATAGERARRVFDVYDKLLLADGHDGNAIAACGTQLVAALELRPATGAESAAVKALALEAAPRAERLRAALIAAGKAAPHIHLASALEFLRRSEFGAGAEVAVAGLAAARPLPETDPKVVRGLHEAAARGGLLGQNYGAAAVHLEALLADKETQGVGHLYTGLVASIQGRHERALRHYLQAEKGLGQTPQVRMALASTYAALHRWTDALPQLDIVRGLLESQDAEQRAWAERFQINRTSLHWLRLQALLALGRWETAQEGFDTLRDTPLEPRALALGTSWLWNHQQPAEARRWLAAARAKFPREATLLRIEALLLQHEGQADQAAELIEEAAAAAPDDLPLQLLHARWCAHRGQTEDSLQLLEQLATRFPNSRAIQSLRGELLLAEGRTGDALAVAGELQTSPDTKALGSLMAALAELEEDDLKSASLNLDSAATSTPVPGALSLLQGELALAQGDYVAAIDAVDDSLDVTALQGRARQMMLVAILKVAEQQGAAAAAERLQPLLTQYPDDPFLWIVRADLEFKQGQLAAGMQTLQNAEALQPGSPHAAYLRAGVWLQARDLRRAEAEITRALQIAPRHLPSLTLSAAIHQAAKKYERVLADTEAAMAVQPQPGNAVLLRALALEQLERRPEAVRLLMAALEQQPRWLGGYRVLASLYERGGQRGSALEVCRQGRQQLPEAFLLVIDELVLLCRDDRLDEARQLAADQAGQPPSLERCFLVARAFSAADCFAEARAWGEQALALANEAQQPQVHLLLGGAAAQADPRCEQRELQTYARDHFAAVLRTQPDHLLAGNNLAWTLAMHFGETDEALRIVDQIRRNREIASLPVTVLDTLLVVYRLAGQYERALQLADEGLTLQPKHPLLRFHRGLILESLQRADEARGELERALEYGLAGEQAATAKQKVSELEGK